MKILLVGLGLIGSKHAKLLYENEDLILEAIVVPNIEKYKELGKKYSARMYRDLETALIEQHFDGVIISSPNQFHFEQVKLCIDYNIPTLVEKPLTSNLIEAKLLVELAEEKSIPLLVADHRLYNPLLGLAKSFISSDKFGKIVSYIGSAQYYKPDSYFKAGTWRNKIGGGPILINLIHEIGIMRILCGEIEKVSAFASNETRGFEVEDTVSIILHFKNGSLGTFMLSDTVVSNKSWEMTTGENHAYPSYPKEWTYHIAGTKASLDFPNMRVRTYDKSFEASWWRPFYDEKLYIESQNPLEVQLKHFSQVLFGKVEPISTARNGYMNMLVIEAIKRSIQEQKLVYIDEKSLAKV